MIGWLDREFSARILYASSRQDSWEMLKQYPYVVEYLDGINSIDDIEEINLTSATELEFWVKTPTMTKRTEISFPPRRSLRSSTGKRTIGPVNTALEQTLEILDRYGFGVEMGHKEGWRSKS